MSDQSELMDTQTVSYYVIVQYLATYLWIYVALALAFVTKPAKGTKYINTKYIISQNCTYHELCVQYLLSVSCKVLPMKLFIDGKHVTNIALADH